jgi:predicted transcriptional regulator
MATRSTRPPTCPKHCKPLVKWGRKWVCPDCTCLGCGRPLPARDRSRLCPACRPSTVLARVIAPTWHALVVNAKANPDHPTTRRWLNELLPYARQLPGSHASETDTLNTVEVWLRDRHGMTVEQARTLPLAEVVKRLRQPEGRDAADRRKLPQSRRAILKLCKRKPMRGETIAHHNTVGLDYDYCRKVLAAMRKDGLLTNDEEGYQTTEKGNRLLLSRV